MFQINNINIRELFAFILYVVISVQSIVIFSIGNASLKPYHLLVVIFAGFVALSGKIRFIYAWWPFYLYAACVLILSLLDYADVGFNMMFANYLFAFCLFSAVGLYCQGLSYEKALRQLRFAAWLIAVLILIDIAVSHRSGQPGRIQLVFSIYGGGINLEATWAALASSFFLRQKKEFIIYVIVSFLINYFMGSRAAFVITVVALCYWLWLNRKDIKITYLLSCAVVVGIYLWYLISGGEIGQRFFDRFLRLGSSGWGSGREVLLHYVTQALWDRPYFGWGAGNAITALRAHGFAGSEDNVHNYLVQHYLDFGALGLMAWIVFLSFLFFRSSGKAELRCYLLAFTVAGMVQFRGAEPIFYFITPLLLLTTVDNIRSRKSPLDNS